MVVVVMVVRKGRCGDGTRNPQRSSASLHGKEEEDEDRSTETGRAAACDSAGAAAAAAAVG